MVILCKKKTCIFEKFSFKNATSKKLNATDIEFFMRNDSGGGHSLSIICNSKINQINIRKIQNLKEISKKKKSVCKIGYNLFFSKLLTVI